MILKYVSITCISTKMIKTLSSFRWIVFGYSNKINVLYLQCTTYCTVLDVPVKKNCCPLQKCFFVSFLLTSYMNDELWKASKWHQLGILQKKVMELSFDFKYTILTVHYFNASYVNNSSKSIIKFQLYIIIIININYCIFNMKIKICIFIMIIQYYHANQQP